MAKIDGNEIRKRAGELLDKAPDGIRYTTLVNTVQESAPETPINTVHGAVHALLSKSTEYARLSRGLWAAKKYADQTLAPVEVIEAVEIDQQNQKIKISEADFYEPFANWLKDEVEEVTESCVIGGSVFKQKWATPDVVGVYKRLKSDFVDFPLEIVSAEIKIDHSQSITAFGQACAYRLFSHKSYVVMPNKISDEDKDRLEALCSIYGIGFVLFDLEIKNPKFTRIVIAQKKQPDMFYANEFARMIQKRSKHDFERLF